MGWETAVWAYAWDLLDEGFSNALDNMQRAGATSINVATVYHSGKFLHVHNPKRRVVFPESATLYFRPDPSWHGKLRLQPPVWPQVQSYDFWPELRRETRKRGLGLTSWSLCLHNSGIGFRYPDCAVENAYGDRIFTDLCAHHPDVRAYLIEVIQDLATRFGFDRIALESLEYMPFRHGYHHEVIGVPTGPTVDFLMSLCFCSHCRHATEQAGTDFLAIREWARSYLDTHFVAPFTSAPAMSWADLHNAVNGLFGAFLNVRQNALTSLLGEIAEKVRTVSATKLAIIDFGPLYPNGPDGRAWENGVDLAKQLPLVDEIHPTFYFTDPQLHSTKVAEYVRLLASEKPMVPAIRAILPQTGSFEQLADQLAPLAPHSAGFSFYNYGFMPVSTLEWIRKAVQSVRGRER